MHVQLYQSNKYMQTLSRKIVHSLAGPCFVACWPLFGDSVASQWIASLVPALNGLNLFLAGTNAVPDRQAVSAISRSGDPRELLQGPLYYTIVLFLVTVLLWRESLVAISIVSIMCGGDGLADIVGRSMGSGKPLPWNTNKSWPGSLAMFLGGHVTAMVLAYYFSFFHYVEFNAANLTRIGCIAAIATVIESLPINRLIDDNISVPLSVAALGFILL